MEKNFTVTRYLNRSSYFYSYKAGKNKYGSYSNSYSYFLHFNFFCKKYKNQIGTMIYFPTLSVLLYFSQNSKINLKLLAQIPGSINKVTVTKLSTSANIQNNYIKLSDFTFRLDVTRFLPRGKFFNPENSFAVFYDQPYNFFHFPPFNCTLKIQSKMKFDIKKGKAK